MHADALARERPGVVNVPLMLDVVQDNIRLAIRLPHRLDGIARLATYSGKSKRALQVCFAP